METSFLEIKNVAKAFNGNTVLKDVTLSIDRGSITTLMGKSGIGKSVLLKCIAGIHLYDAGKILLLGRECIGPHCGENSPRLSYLFQNNALFDSMTAEENVGLPLVETSRISRRKVRRRVAELFEKLELKGVANLYPAEISGGMQKRVALARALITNPQLILFDEPTTGLDPQRKNTVFSMIAEYRNRFDFTALLVTHDIPEALFVSDRVAWLDQGQIRFEGSPTDLEAVTEPDLLDFIHHRNDLLSETAGLRDRGELFKEWSSLKEKYDRFVIASCITEQSRPGSELGLRRFASLRAATGEIEKISTPHSPIYVLDESHFGFAINGDQECCRQIESLLKSPDSATPSSVLSGYSWHVNYTTFNEISSPTDLWGLKEMINPVSS